MGRRPIRGACVRRVPREQATPRPLLNPVRRPRRSPLATTPTGWLARSDSCRLFFGSRAAVAEMTLAGVVPGALSFGWVTLRHPQGRAEASSRPALSYNGSPPIHELGERCAPTREGRPPPPGPVGCLAPPPAFRLADGDVGDVKPAKVSVYVKLSSRASLPGSRASSSIRADLRRVECTYRLRRDTQLPIPGGGHRGRTAVREGRRVGLDQIAALVGAVDGRRVGGHQAHRHVGVPRPPRARMRCSRRRGLRSPRTGAYPRRGASCPGHSRS